MEAAKTVFLLTALTVLFVWIGGMIGGQMGMLIAFVIAVGMNFFSYFNSDKLVLKHYNAVEVNENQAKGLYDMVRRLSERAETPMPKVYIIPDHVPNAFATGRNHSNAAVAVTEGLLEILNDNEVEGVLAHEMSHVKHYDILVGTIAATIAGAIAMLANFGMMFGGGSSENRPNPIVMIALMFLAPMAASIVQMAVSRNREFMADEGAARLTGHPEWLQSALIKLDNYSRGHAVMHEATPATAHMFIVNPFSGKDISFKALFSTHPKTEDRLARLEKLKI
ncbi:MAG TPA: zinc metalloprotease HtpX [Campylobacterales bacterium]|nr:zinc metalloprotease HtpX [Campylobacterales bacterium]